MSGPSALHARGYRCPLVRTAVRPVRPAGTVEPMSDERIESQWWYNDKTGVVEQGLKSPNRHHIGPFANRDEAAHALDRIRANNERADAADGDA